MTVVMSVAEYLAECVRRGLCPPDFQPNGVTDHEKMVSITCRAQNGLHEKHGCKVPDVPYAPKGQRGTVMDVDDQLTQGAYVPEPPESAGPTSFDLELEAHKLGRAKKMDQPHPPVTHRDLPKGDAWEPEEPEPPKTTPTEPENASEIRKRLGIDS